MKTQIIPLHLFFSSTYNNPHHNNQNHSIPNIYSLFDLLLWSVVKKENWLNRPRAIFPRKISYAFSIENGDLLLDREGRAKGDYINKWDKRRSIVACTCRLRDYGGGCSLANSRVFTFDPLIRKQDADRGVADEPPLSLNAPPLSLNSLDCPDLERTCSEKGLVLLKANTASVYTGETRMFGIDFD